MGTQAEAFSKEPVADRSCGDGRSCQRGPRPFTQQSGTLARVSTKPHGCLLGDENAVFLLLLGWNKTLKN